MGRLRTLAQLNTAAHAAVEIAGLPATANSNKAEQNESKTIRDKTCTHLKELVEGVCKAGKYLFMRNSIRL